VGSKKSRIVISLENLVTILPNGFYSKKLSFALVTLSAIELWRRVLELTVKTNNKMHLIKATRMNTRIERQNHPNLLSWSSLHSPPSRYFYCSVGEVS
jgi:hypothetical protein